ncbi:discoidin domain-containing protein [Ectothiorhodospiraceae bacterium 2226]|nr:discoidin domain-containing protein [Ectothiorhodospiraceae bacterium 2226]
MPSTLTFARRVLPPLALMTLAACGGGDGPLNSSPPTVTSQAITLQGTVSDGPVIEANIVARDAAGRSIGSTTSDANARYTIRIPEGTPLPVTLVASGGTDIVSADAPAFTLKSASFATSSATANINAYSTIAVRTARKMDGGLNAANMERAIGHVVRQFNFGLDTFAMPDPITTPVTGNNVATAVRANEALAQAIKRTQAALQQGADLTAAQMSHDDLLEALAADMVDGVLDGNGASGANPRSAAVANLASAAVLIEALHDNLHVNGQNANAALDAAISLLLPDNDERIAHSPPSPLMVDQAVTVLTAVREATSAPGIDEALAAVRALDVESAEELRSVLSADLGVELEQTTMSIAVSEDAELIDRINASVREAVVVYEPAPGATPACAAVEQIPAVAVRASAEQVGNYAAHVIDGNPETRWAGGGEPMPHWITLDLGGVHMVNRTRLSFFNHDNGRVYRYSVHGSLDGETWLPVFQNRESQPARWTEADFAGINARYVRVTLESANDSDAASMWAAEVHGRPAGMACAVPTVRVRWSANGDDVNGYRVFAGPSPSNTEQLLSDLPVSSGAIDPDQPAFQYRPWEDLGIRSGENICFRLRAYNDHGQSGWSDARCAGI